MAIFPDNVLRVTAKMTGVDGQDIQNVYHFLKVSAGTIPDADGQADIALMLDNAYALIEGHFSSVVSFDTIGFFNVTQGVPLPDQAWNSMTVGGGSANPLPAGVAALVTFPTPASKIRGRKYLGSFTVEGLSGGNFFGSVLTDLAAYGSQFITGFTGPVSGDIWLPGVPVAGPALYGFVSAVVSAEPAYQRRRREGVGS